MWASSDTEPVPLSQRPEFAALGSGSVTDRIDAAARMLTGINRRTWGLRRALHEAAGSEPQLAARLHELERRRRDNIRQGVEMVVGRPVEDDVLDGIVGGHGRRRLLSPHPGRGRPRRRLRAVAGDDDPPARRASTTRDTCRSVGPQATLVWRTVPTPLFPDSTQWGLRLEPTSDGRTVIRQSFTVLRAPG